MTRPGNRHIEGETPKRGYHHRGREMAPSWSLGCFAHTEAPGHSDAWYGRASERNVIAASQSLSVVWGCGGRDRASERSVVQAASEERTFARLAAAGTTLLLAAVDRVEIEASNVRWLVRSLVAL